MSLEENKSIARRFIQIWGQGPLDIIDELADPSIMVYYPIFPTIITNSKSFINVMENFRLAFPDSSIHIEDEIAENEKVVIRWIFSGTHKNNLLNLPPTNIEVHWSGITIYHIIDRKIVKETGEEDFLGFLRQIGVVKHL